MMFRSLYSKLATVLLGLFILIGITFVLVSVYSTEMYQQEVNQKLNREIAKLIVSEKIIMEKSRINEDALAEIFHMLMVINPSIELYLLDPEGNILAFSAEPGKVKRSRIDMEPVRNFLDGDMLFPLQGDDPRNLKGKKVFTAARIPEKGRLEGYLYVILGGEIYDTVIQKLQGSYIFRLSTWAIVASILVAVITGLVIFGCLTRRLRRLSTAMNSYTSGIPPGQLDLPSINEEHPSDEIDMLVSAFRVMAGRIEEQVESLKKADAVRRELVANVSHDLRTPLATLQGYMETLLMKRDQLTPEEKRTYIEIAIKHCKRLSKLVADLFELVKLESKDTYIDQEPFNVGELIQDVIQKFHLLAKERKINVVTNVKGDMPFVYADIGLIERVLENLLENALRYSPEEGSVSIVLKPSPERITVEVSDTGPGIPEEEIHRIFDRFYQIDKSRKERVAHSGLGLAIAKHIIELHGSTIEVESVLNRGTTFSFSLSVYRADASH